MLEVALEYGGEFDDPTVKAHENVTVAADGGRCKLNFCTNEGSVTIVVADPDDFEKLLTSINDAGHTILGSLRAQKTLKGDT